MLVKTDLFLIHSFLFRFVNVLGFSPHLRYKYHIFKLFCGRHEVTILLLTLHSNGQIKTGITLDILLKVSGVWFPRLELNIQKIHNPLYKRHLKNCVKSSGVTVFSAEQHEARV